MKRALTIVAVTAGVLVALVVILAMTPVGWRAAARLAAGAVERRAGLDLAIGSLRGNLLSHVTVTGARLSVPGGPTILEVEEIEADYDLHALLTRRVVVPKLRASHAELLFEIGPDGEPTGWSRFATGAADTAAPGGPWSVDVDLALEDWTVVFRDTAAGYQVGVAGLDVRAAGGMDDFQASLSGSLRVRSSGLARPIEGTVSADVEGDGEDVRIKRLHVATGEGRAAVRGVVSTGAAPPSLDLTIDSAIDLAAIASLGRRESGGGPKGSVATGQARDAGAIDGRLAITAAVGGPTDSVHYGLGISGSDIVIAGLDIARAEVRASGDTERLDVERFTVATLGGEVSGLATVGLAGLAGDPPRVPYDVVLSLDGLDLAEFESLLPEGVGLQGALSGGAQLASASSDLRDLTGTFDISVAGFAVGDTLLGNLAVEGAIAEGMLEAEARCCESVITARVAVESTGVGEVAFAGDLRDLSAWGRAYGMPGLGGRGTVEGAITPEADGVALEAVAELPNLTYDALEIGPARIELAGQDTAYAAGFQAFGDVVDGTASFGASGRYTVTARIDSFDLAAVVADSIQKRLDFEGSVTAAVSVAGRGREPPAIRGTVLDLLLSARGERAYLTTPFQFEAAPDTVHITWASLEGTFGSVSVTGGMSVRKSGQIVARLGGIDLAAIANVVPDGLPAPLLGTIDGEVRLVGRRDRPRFASDIEVSDFAYGGLALRTMSLRAENDSTDVLFELTAESAVAGSVQAFGSVPVVPDSIFFMLPDPSREFGANAIFSDFTVDAGASLLPNIRGTKRFRADGAVLLTGIADSLGSLQGRGSFGTMSATFDLVDFTLVEPVEFEIAGGDVQLAETTIAVTRRRVLADQEGGVATVGGLVRGDGSADLSIRAQGLDVGQLVRAFGPEPRTDVRGSLDVEARVSGDLDDPLVDLTWNLERPVFFEYGFDRSIGRARIADGILAIEEATLSSGGRSVSATGAIPLPMPESVAAEASRARELDLRISAGDFRLGGLASLPPEIESLEGRVFCDLTIGGTPEAPLPVGTVVVRDGSLAGFGLKEPIRNIAFEVRAEGGTIVLTEARAQAGRGTFAAAGAVETRADGAAPFWIRVRLESPEIKVEDSFETRLRGSLTWAGVPRASELSGRVVVEKLDVTHPIGLIDLLTNRPAAVTVRRPSASLSRVALDIDVEVEDEIRVRNGLANLDLTGGFHVGGTMLAPEVGGGLYAEGGSFRYLDNVFEIESLEVVYLDPKRRDPHVHLLGTATVTDRSEEDYAVTVLFEGFAFETLPQLSSDPPLNQGDIVALLTFGDTFGGLLAGEAPAGSSGDRFSQLARGAFVSSLFGVAESTLERMLRLDTVAVDEEAVASGGIVGAGVTVGKTFADRLRVNYTTAVGEFGEQEVEVAFRLNRQISIETRADPEGNHAIGLRLRIPFR